MGNCGGERAICSREWLAAPPYVLLPQQEVTELLKQANGDRIETNNVSKPLTWLLAPAGGILPG
jgi:hypothetical protein